ncbi:MULTISPECIES: hypothetical protein [Acinetobacter]|uniref:Uncharacterized protein n=1 Tax=Acinetobacter bereziniae TaxID=106648 RepID=A0A7T4PBC8_ACIBZ|nr:MULTISPECIES: hypothetical protein [Acinetobacter]WDM41706.1 hypothetical protein KNV99_20850 [Acinetobacter nosocomialis]AZM37902.1 hypothetical protein EJP75_04535 [Acinetobacter baumannii]ELD1822463.1 hypothetical protein [Acinetobacter baumannii]MDQ8975649.1 hypothetical protein [Acinetobacter johnsonii]NWK60614.1 hypothetical protein [Acinetobacter sp. SwsAc2]
MIFAQSASNTALFLYQFVLPFVTTTPKILKLKKKVGSLMKQKPDRNKDKQEEFTKCYVQIWQQIIEILKTDSAVRAHVYYMPQLQLIRELDIYIDPEVQADVFGQSGKLSAYFLMTFFNLRNEEAKKQVKELLKIKRQCDLSPEEKIEL